MPAAWEGRWAEFIRRIAALRESTALEILPDLMPVAPVLDPAAPEHLLSRRERLCGGFAQVAAGGAGTYATISLNNPSSNMLVVLDAAVINSSSAVYWEVFAAQSSDAIISQVTTLEGRGPGTSVIAPVVGVLRAAAVGVAVTHKGGWLPVCNGTNPSFFPCPAIIPPGFRVSFQTQTANTPLNMGMRWRERAVDSAELGASGA